MERFEFHLYPLRGKKAEREGALLRLRFEPWGYGYCDLHPWTELGDAALGLQLRLLAQGQTTPLLRQSIRFARLDAEARAQGRSLFEGLRVPQSHALIDDPMGLGTAELERLKEAGFTRLKLKVGREPGELESLVALRSRIAELGLKLRLDFNLRVSAPEAAAFAAGLSEVIDWLEDPCAYELETWRSLGCRVAADRVDVDDEALESHAYSVRVIKPAVQDAEKLARVEKQNGRAICVTSYLDHPLGQTAAAWSAATLPGVSELCGLVSHSVYERTEFSRQLGEASPEFNAPAGTGFGFDRLLEGLSWRAPA